MRNLGLGVRFSDVYRTVPETQILEMLMLAGWAYEQANPKALIETKQALNSWIDMGLGTQKASTGERLFDPVEVVNLMKSLGLAGQDSFWANRYVHTGRNLVTDLKSDSDRGFAVDFRRTFSMRTVPKGKSLRLRAPLPLASFYGDGLSIVPIVQGASDARLSSSDGRLEARAVAGDEDITLGATLMFAQRGSCQDNGSPADHSAYLKSREGLIAISDAVRALAAKLAHSAATPASTVRAFWNYMVDELACGAIHYDQIKLDAPCDTVLETGWYDCQLGSALFIALCRARDIPARLVGGHVLYRRAPTNHYWAEAWIEDEGWLPFDFLSWDLSLGGSDLRWRDHFYSRIDQRMITQLLPLKFTGALGVPMPAAWHIVQTAKDEGVLISLSAVSGEPIYSDFVSVSGCISEPRNLR